MSLILIVSIAILLVATGWSIVLVRSMRDWRMGFLTVMLGLMAMRQTLTLLTEKESWAISVAGHTTELHGLIVSFHPEMALFHNLCVNLRDCLCDVPNVRLRTIP